MKKSNKHLGSKLDLFLQEGELLEEVEAMAIKQVISLQLQQEMEKKNISKSRMATIMHTSRSSLDRLLDPENTAVTLNTLIKAASVINKKLDIRLSDLR